MNPTAKDKRQRSSQHRTKQGKKKSHLLVSVSDQPPEILPRDEVAEFRNSIHRNICVRLLQEGNHRSFSELVSLCETHNEHRAAAKPGSALNLQTPLEEQGDKLETIRLHLSRAEEADRRGSWSEVCEQRLLLAQYFSAPVDQWLSLHFYHSCADREQGGYSRPATEARACMAELYLQQGELQEALHQAEQCISQAEEGGWLDSSGRPLRVRACLTLCDIYNHLAEDQLDSAKYKEALELLHRSHDVAAESNALKTSACVDL
ncbi:hypothetical protein INR49_007094 [Caranx melampygus]|nr:hypothetical protein INR49_007094 [Caranx melampygus]